MAAPKTDARLAALLISAKKAKIKALVSLAACTGCEVCIAVCPVERCIEKFGTDPSNFGVYVNYDRCIGCMLCVKDCPWDTIRMVPTEAVATHRSSLDSQLNHEHVVFEKTDLVPEDVRTFVGKEPMSNPTVKELFQKQNPQVPNVMGPK